MAISYWPAWKTAPRPCSSLIRTFSQPNWPQRHHSTGLSPARLVACSLSILGQAISVDFIKEPPAWTFMKTGLFRHSAAWHILKRQHKVNTEGSFHPPQLERGVCLSNTAAFGNQNRNREEIRWGQQERKSSSLCVFDSCHCLEDVTFIRTCLNVYA